MDAILKKLLATETQAEQLVTDATAGGRAKVTAAQEEARALEEGFEQSVPDIKAAHIDKAEARAEQAITELKRRNDERDRQLRAAAEAHQQAALSAALHLFTPGGSD